MLRGCVELCVPEVWFVLQKSEVDFTSVCYGQHSRLFVGSSTGMCVCVEERREEEEEEEGGGAGEKGGRYWVRLCNSPL